MMDALFVVDPIMVCSKARHSWSSLSVGMTAMTLIFGGIC